MKIFKNNGPCWLLLAFVIAAAVSYCANARAETSLYVGAWSKHLVSEGDLNEEHQLVAVEHDNLIAGRFVNSYNRETWFAAHKWAWRYKGLEAGVYGGLMRGYSKCYGEDGSGSNICPMAAPYFTWDAGPVSPVLFLLGDAVAISIKISL